MGASAGAIRSGKAFVEVFEDSSPLRRGLAKTSQHLKAWGASVGRIATGAAGITAAAIGSASVATIALGKDLIDTGANADDMAQRTGLSTAAVLELGYAASQSGTSIEDLETGVRMMSKTIGEAANGSEEARAKLKYLGLSLEQLRKMTPEQQLSVIADKMKMIVNPTGKATAAMMIFGKSGAKLIPLLNDGSAGLADMRKRAQELGITMDSKTSAAAAELDDRIQELKMQFQFASNGLLAQFLPAMIAATRVTSFFVGAWSKGMGFIANGAPLLAAAAGLTVIIKPIQNTVAAFGALFNAINAGDTGAAWEVFTSSAAYALTSVTSLFAHHTVNWGTSIRLAMLDAFGFVEMQWAALIDRLTAAWQVMVDRITAQYRNTQNLLGTRRSLAITMPLAALGITSAEAPKPAEQTASRQDQVAQRLADQRAALELSRKASHAGHDAALTAAQSRFEKALNAANALKPAGGRRAGAGDVPELDLAEAPSKAHHGMDKAENLASSADIRTQEGLSTALSALTHSTDEQKVAANTASMAASLAHTNQILGDIK